MNISQDPHIDADNDASARSAAGDEQGGVSEKKNRRFGLRGPGRRHGGKKPKARDLATEGVRHDEATNEGVAIAGGESAQNSPPSYPVAADFMQEPDAQKPQRLHKALAQTGLGSRRKMEALIAEGVVEVNGATAQVGQTVQAGDRVHVKRRKVNVKLTDDKPRVMIYHKPAGEIVSREDPEGRPTVFESLKAPDHGKWVAVGRLDFNSEGLLLFTTYGELANRLMHPSYQILREYSVRILGELTPEQEDQLIDGIELEDGPARVLSLEEEGGEGANRWYRITLQEGRNREVRRMFEALGLTVSRLIRIRYGTITMPSWLKRGQSKLLDETETFALLESVGLRSNSPRAQLKRALKHGVPAAQKPVGAMRNAREHELARDGRLGDDPALRTAGRGKQRGKPRIDALATSFGFAAPAPRLGRNPNARTNVNLNGNFGGKLGGKPGGKAGGKARGQTSGNFANLAAGQTRRTRVVKSSDADNIGNVAYVGDIGNVGNVANSGNGGNDANRGNKRSNNPRKVGNGGAGAAKNSQARFKRKSGGNAINSNANAMFPSGGVSGYSKNGASNTMTERRNPRPRNGKNGSAEYNDQPRTPTAPVVQVQQKRTRRFTVPIPGAPDNSDLT